MDNPEQVFGEPGIRDPKIEVSNNAICLKPNYWNFSFATAFLPIGFVVYLLVVIGHKFDKATFWVDQTNLYVILAVISFPVILFLELRYYNTIIVNFVDRTISVIPSSILKPFLKHQLFLFREVDGIEPIRISGRIGWSRSFAIGLILKNADEIKLLSTNDYIMAKEVSEKLSGILWPAQPKKDYN